MRWWREASRARRVVVILYFIFFVIFLAGVSARVPWLEWAVVPAIALLTVNAVLAYRGWSHAPTHRDD